MYYHSLEQSSYWKANNVHTNNISKENVCFKLFKFYRKTTYLPSVNTTCNQRIMPRHVGTTYRLHHLLQTSLDSHKNLLISTFVSSKLTLYYIPKETLLYRQQKHLSLLVQYITVYQMQKVR
jgi:hypothetical protein